MARSKLCWVVGFLALCLPPWWTVTSEDSLSSLLLLDEVSNQSRNLASLGKVATTPSQPVFRRRSYPEQQPHICLAFLSCCQRTDLLNHTLAGTIRHMEEDEPSFLRYEVAWVDNGSDRTLTSIIRDTYQIEHSLTLPNNMGLAYGMNLLIQNLCTAPYILLLEEDWLYLDELVAQQTPERKRAVTTSIALIENLKRNHVTAFDGRNIMGVFLRHESYESFLSFPYADVWERQVDVDLQGELESLPRSDPSTTESCPNKDSSDATNMTVNVDYRVFCADTGLGKEAIWGSYTNGAGLYNRADLMEVGRMFGEPGDAFHDRYVEGNFAYRVALRNCHAALRLTNDTTCTSIHDSNCAGAFHHIGGGRGTRPRTVEGTKCDDLTWNFLGTPLYEKYHKHVTQMTGQEPQLCSREELQKLRDRRFRDTDAEAYREQIRMENEEVFQQEAHERQTIREQAQFILQLLKSDPEALRAGVPWMKDLLDNEIEKMALRMHRLADSPHPLDGYWDSHGRIENRDSQDKRAP